MALPSSVTRANGNGVPSFRVHCIKALCDPSLSVASQVIVTDSPNFVM